VGFLQTFSAVDIGTTESRESAQPWPPGCNDTVELPSRAQVAALIGIRTPAAMEAKRQEIIDFIWKGRGLPRSDAVRLRANVSNPITTLELKNLAAVDELVVTMDSLTSHIYRFRSKVSNGRLALYHAGHTASPWAAGGDITISAFLARGYDILAFSMPGYGSNAIFSQSLATTSPHDSFAPLETEAFTPLQYFVEPIAIALNYVMNRHDYTDVRMIGISGGGWTTTLYAAIDPRIRVSYPVAGSLPLYLRTTTCGAPEMGDWEQSLSGLYALVDYSELYVLGGYGAGRKQVQVLNQFDSCCFWGTRYRSYEGKVRQVSKGLGFGSFKVVLDSSLIG